MQDARSAILDALESLSVDELKKFKLKLMCVTLRDGYGRIPRGTLLPMDAVDLSDKLVSCYLEAYATELTATVLCDMGMQEQAGQLSSGGGRNGSGRAASLREAPVRLDPTRSLRRRPARRQDAQEEGDETDQTAVFIRNALRMKVGLEFAQPVTFTDIIVATVV
ncbi:pyrin domain-containing protein 1 [Octodon degus]|uniref:Pyrin domain-containing protein 1 n=1 Tax=Octodon degus TaxID=10160 RepID=A0A6P3V9Y7_OCTDE|nr:pyrin domain-containing protein 1 [Octodon degus]